MENHEFLDHKVGIKILDDNKLENIFPMYKSLKNKIDDCRKAAYTQRYQSIKKHYQYNYMYDNVFSILGERGTGKTSVAFTLKEIIEKESKTKNHYDTVLPIIIPEAIPENCTILGWLLAVVKEEVEHLKIQLKQQKKDAYEEHDAYWNTCRYPAESTENGIDHLSKKLSHLSKMFFAGNYNPANEHSYYEAIGNSAVQVEDYYQFAHEIAELWDIWIDVLCDLAKNDSEPKQKKCPLIYFIFDDVDLAPEKIGELLSVIIKYLSHPNLIVITTADENLFLEVIENRLDKNIGRLPREWRTYLSKENQGKFVYLDDNNITEMKEQDFIGMTALRYLGKVMPPSTRYYLRLFKTASQKEHFQLEKNKTLGECVWMQIDRLLKCVIRGKNKPDCFMGKNNNICNFYLNFFGNTSRQIGNIYIGIKDLVDNLVAEINSCKKELYKKQYYLSRVYEICKYFINIVIHTNHNLSNIRDDVDEFINELFLMEYMGWKLYVNYAYLDEFLETFSEDDIQLNLSVGLQLYSLLAFIENILLILESCTKFGITGRREISVVKKIASYLNNYILNGRHVFRTNFNANKFFQHYGLLLDSLNKIIADSDSDKKFDMEYFYLFKNQSCEENAIGFHEFLQIYQDNPHWLKEMVKMTSMVYGSTYLIDEKLLESIIPQGNEISKFGYQVYIERALEENIKDYLEVFDLHGAAKKFIQSTNKLKPKVTEDYYKAFAPQLKNKLLQELPISFPSRKQDTTHLFLPLATIIHYVEDSFLKIENLLEHCPQEITNVIEEISQDSLNEMVIQDLLEKELANIERIEWLVNSVTFYNPENWLVVIGEIKRHENPTVRRKAKELHKIINQTFQKSELKESPEQITCRLGLGDLSRIQTFLEELSDDLKYDSDLNGVLLELSNDLDIAVNINHPDEFEKAIKIGMHLLLAKYLQRLHIALKVKVSYESGSYLSSKNLQWISTDSGQDKKTYYYQLFEIIKHIVEGTLPVTKEEKQNKRFQRNLNELGRMIHIITRSHKRKYIDNILREIQ